MLCSVFYHPSDESWLHDERPRHHRGQRPHQLHGHRGLRCLQLPHLGWQPGRLSTQQYHAYDLPRTHHTKRNLRMLEVIVETVTQGLLLGQLFFFVEGIGLGLGLQLCFFG